MKTQSISRNSLKKFERLKLSKAVFNTEAQMYQFTEKTKWNTSEKVAKIFYNNVGDSFGNKLLTLSALMDKKSLIDIEEIVMPEKLIISDGSIIGYTMSYIDNINLRDIYEDYKYDSKVVLEYLKQIGEIFEKIEKLNKYKVVTPFYLNDVHESNFILNKKTGKINVVDIDSCRISNNKPFAARYLTPLSPVAEMPFKYHICTSEEKIGYIEPNMNSELYCYNIMILNYIYRGSVQKLTMEEFYDYLNYLESLNFPKELLDSFSKLYNYVDNSNPKDLLDEIPNTLPQAHRNVYRLRKNII